MKPAAFGYVRPDSLDDALHRLASEGEGARVLGGGQSLGPMLNLRLARPHLLIDISRLPELRAHGRRGEMLEIGACVPHAAIEDGLVDDVTVGLLPRVARGIAYRAVRTRGTVGGSLAHADPAADWLSCFALLDARLVLAGPDGARRTVAAETFVSAPFTTALAPGEILASVRVPALSAEARWGWYKFCRKTGEFAEAIAAVVVDPARDVCRGVVGAVEGPPVVIEDAHWLVDGFDVERAMSMIDAGAPALDDYGRQVHLAALRRAAGQARMPA